MVIGELCCFQKWTGWAQSTLSCGRVCNQRTRKLIKGVGGIFGACHNDFTSCPWFELQEASCRNINCREFVFY